MLTADTKRKIDAARQVLVGKVPDPKGQIDQITNALIYKFMDDMDEKARAMGGTPSFFVGDLESYAWSKLMDSSIGAQDRFNLYEEVFKKFQSSTNLPKLFRDILKDARLPYNDPNTLTLFLKEIDWFSYDHSEELGNAFEYLLLIMGSQGDAGQFRTPRHIIDFVVAAVDPQKGDRILDPACGTAGFLISAYNHVITQNDGKDNVTGAKTSKEKQLTFAEKKKLIENLNGYDIAPEMAKLARVNLYLHGAQNPQIEEYDTLSSEKNWDEYYDVILANPPFMTPKGGIIPHKRFGIKANKAEVLFVDYIVEHLSSHGRAGIIVPEGIIFSSNKAYKDLRKLLLEQGLYAVVSLPSGVFNPYAGVKTSVLLIDKTLKNKSGFLFVEIKNDGYHLGATRTLIDKNDLPEALKSIHEFRNTGATKGAGTLIVSKEEIAKTGEYNLTASRYKVEEDFSNAKWEMVELGELDKQEKITFLRGQGLTKKDIVENGKNKCILYGDIYTKYDIQIKNIISYTNEAGKILSQKGDVLVPATTTADAMGIAVARSLNIEGVVLGGDINIIRTDNKFILSDYLAYLISNPPLKMELAKYAKGANILHISNTDLKKLKIPLPPLHIQEEIVKEIEGYQAIIDGAKKVIENWKPKIDIDPEWESVPIGEICKLTTGGTPLTSKKEYYENGNIKWLVSGDINRGEIFDCEGRITELAILESNAKILPIDSVLIALNGQGKTRGTVAILRTEAACNQSLVSINPDRNKLIPEFLLYILMGMYKMIRDINGDNQRGGLNMPIIRSIKVPLPPIVTQKQIVGKIEEERKLVEANKKLVEIYESKIKEVIQKVWR